MTLLSGSQPRQLKQRIKQPSPQVKNPSQAWRINVKIYSKNTPREIMIKQVQDVCFGPIAGGARSLQLIK
jgi:hypothetical protein